MPPSVEVVGLVQLGETLDILKNNVEKKYIRHAVSKGAQLFKDAVKSRAPVLTGALLKSVSVKVLRPFEHGLTELIGFVYKGIRANKQGKPRNPARTARGGASTEDPGVYAKFVELGTFNTAPHPFVRPAFEAVKNKVAEAVGKDLMEQIDQEIH